ncbi:hypothetical protein EVJ58_g4333 [Rhodofomes roseus]|uniref:Uncharacterized protein n=1 Tax=Rhodofomes roseus TaxID=34475 RepID=A0A4Y9YHV9_9APHY|nr:hypothetical protein EVJ58_g4333 [Rhodofomes roseus]
MSSRASTTNAMDTALRHIHERCSHASLTDIEVSVGDDAEPEEQGVQAITAGILQRLGDFHSLRNLYFSTEMCIVLDDDALKGLAMSWSRMESLELMSGVSYPWRTPTATTLQGIAYLARYCPSLSSLSIDVDTSATDVSFNTTPGGGYCNGNLRRISFGRSRAHGKPEKIAAFLLAIFPNLKMVENDEDDAEDDDEDDEEHEEQDKSWGPVRDVLQVLQMTVHWQRRAGGSAKSHATQFV